MNILFLTTIPPYPPNDGARIRTFNLIKALVRVHNIHLVSFVSETTRQEDIEALRDFVHDVETVFRPSRYAFSDLVKGICTGDPFTIINYRSDEMSRVVKRKLAEGCDAVHCEHLNMAQYAPSDRDVVKVLDMHNIESEIMLRYSDAIWDPFRKTFARITAHKLARYEKECVKRFDACIAVSRRDAEYLRAACPNSIVVDNGVDLDLFDFRRDTVDEPRLVYSGWMKYHANDDAARYFCSEIFPLIRKKIPETTFSIVGKEPSEDVVRLGKMDGVEVTGAVPDVRPYVYGASVYVVPLRVGGGTRLKILEAMAAGVPVVSTSVGCEGLDVVPDRHLLVADTPDKFAEKTVRLLEDRELGCRLALEGRALVEKRYGWNVVCNKLVDLYDSLLNGMTTRERRIEG